MAVPNEIVDNKPQALGRIDRLFAIVDRIPGGMCTNRQRGLHFRANLVYYMLVG